MPDLRGLAVLTLAVGTSVAIVAIAIGAAVHQGPISMEESTLLATVLGAAVGALATFLGLQGHAEDHNHDQGPPRPPRI